MVVVSSEAWPERMCFPNPMVVGSIQFLGCCQTESMGQSSLCPSLPTPFRSDCFISHSAGTGDGGEPSWRKGVLQSYVGSIMEVISCHFYYVLLVRRSHRSSPAPTPSHTHWMGGDHARCDFGRGEHGDHIRVCPNCIIKVKSPRNQWGLIIWFLLFDYFLSFFNYIFLCLYRVCLLSKATYCSLISHSSPLMGSLSSLLG